MTDDADIRRTPRQPKLSTETTRAANATDQEKVAMLLEEEPDNGSPISDDPGAIQYFQHGIIIGTDIGSGDEDYPPVFEPDIQEDLDDGNSHYISGPTLLSGMSPDDNADPLTPTGLAVTAGLGAIKLSWTANTEVDMVDGYGEYRLQVDNNSDFSSPVTDDLFNTTGTVVSGLTTGTTYYARIMARDAHGNESAWTTSVNAAPLEVGDTDIAANAITAAKIASWEIEAGKHIQSSNWDGDAIADATDTVGFRMESSGGKAKFSDIIARGTFQTDDDGEIRAALEDDKLRFYTELTGETEAATIATWIDDPGVTDQPYTWIASPNLGHGKAFLHLISGNYAQTASAGFYAGDGKGSTLRLADDTFTLVGDPQIQISEVIKTDAFYRETDISAFGNTAYQYITASELVVFAHEDDILQISFSGSAGNVANSAYIDCEVAESGNLVSGEGTSGVGMRCWGAATGAACTFGGTHLYKVLAADLTPSTGLGTTVDLQFKIKTNASTPTRTFYHPFHGNVVNLGKNYYHGSW